MINEKQVPGDLNELWKNIPKELADLILRFDGTIRKRRGEYINQIPPYDARYNMLCSIPRPVVNYDDEENIKYTVQFTNHAWMSLTKVILSQFGHHYTKPCRFNHGELQIVDYQGIRYYVRNKVQRCLESYSFEAHHHHKNNLNPSRFNIL